MNIPYANCAKDMRDILANKKQGAHYQYAPRNSFYASR